MVVIKKLLEELDASVGDDALRSKFQFIWLFRLFMIVALGMTVVNILTVKVMLGWSTFIFAVICGIDVLLAQKNGRTLKIASILFVPEFFALLIFFIISGTPEGFSAIWICMLPTFGIMLYGRVKGTEISTVMLFIVIFFFDTPWGVRCLQYPYTASFRLRFPMIYISFYFISLFMETVRVLTQRKLVKAQEQYRYLYAHDALTGLYNRYGFNMVIGDAFAQDTPDGLTLSIVDIDHFKNVNDTFGHYDGDLVLKEIAARLIQCDNGTNVVCRWGGEEFAILTKNWRKAAELGEALCEAVRSKEVSIGEKRIMVTVSVGVCACKTVHGMTIEQCIRQADQCLYSAKENGRNHAVVKVLENV